MTLKELQKMIKEEFSHFVKEQGPMGGPMGGPGGPAGMSKPPMPPTAARLRAKDFLTDLLLRFFLFLAIMNYFEMYILMP